MRFHKERSLADGTPIAPQSATMDRWCLRRPRLARAFYEPSLPHVVLMIGTGAGLFVWAGYLATQLAMSDVPLTIRVAGVMALVAASAHGAHVLEWVGHEGIHLTLHRNRWVSVVMGSFFAAMAAFPAVGYGLAHWSHHRFANQASDPDAHTYSRFHTFWSRLLFAGLVARWTSVENLLKLIGGGPPRFPYQLPFSARAQRGLACVDIACLFFWATVYTVIGVAHPAFVLLSVCLPMAIATAISGLRAYIEHAGTGLGAFRDTRSYGATVCTWLLFGNNHHLEHHLYPGVPCHRLREVHRLLEAEGYLARCGSAVEPGFLGAVGHTSRTSRYPSPAFRDLTDDPFHPTLEPHASAA
jgi:fatty acid desaturase